MLEFLKRIVKLVFGKVYKSMSLNKVILMLIGCLVVIKQYFAMKNIIPEKSMSEFLGMLKKGELQSAKVTSESILALTNQNKVI